MTYKEIINRFRAVVNNHLQLKDFGYGELSDLKTQSQLGPEEQGVDYPYLFLLPAPSVRQGPVMEYSFNMVVMDMARPEEGDQYDNYITIQSQCQQYIDDVLAHLYYYYQDKPEITLTNITYTPFKEKYQDELAGMTATITIQVPTPLNDCITPFSDLVTWITNVEGGLITGGILGPESKIFADTEIINDRNGVGYWNVIGTTSQFTPQGSNFIGDIELVLDMQLVDGTGTVIPEPLGLQGNLMPSTRLVADSVIGYPTTYDTEWHTVTYRWNNVTIRTGGAADDRAFWAVYDFPDAEYDYNYRNVTIKAYYRP